MSQSNSASAAPPAHVKAAKGQPRGLWVVFISEMWERFSYYGMRALLVFYLISKISASNPGFGWTEKSAQLLLAVVTCAVYFTPLLGGWLADRFLGTHRSMLIGGWILAVGQALLFATEYWGYGQNVETVLLSNAPASFLTFMLGLVLIVIGTGMFKPCVSVMVGQLYGADDPRRDSGFTIFYMGINVGAFLSTMVAGTIGENYGWHWGFGSAAVGMVLGLTVYQVVRPFYLKGIGLPPHHKAGRAEGREPTPEEIKQAEIDEYERTRPLTRVDWDRMIVIIVLAVFGIVFWVAFEQAASSLNLFALNWTNRRVLGHEFPATWYQSVNPAAIVILAPVFAGLWAWLDKRGWQPPTPVKFAIGLAILSVAYLAMVFGSLEAGSPKPVELAATPAAVQAPLQSILQQLEKEKKEDAAKEEENRRKQKDDGPAEPTFFQKVAKFFGAGGEEDKKVEFDALEELSYETARYYGVNYVDRRAIIHELFDAKGRLLRRRVERKEDASAPKVKAVKGAKPTAVELAAIPEAARTTILAQTGGRSVQSLVAKVVAKQPIVSTWMDEDRREYEKTYFRRIRDFTATWTGKQGEATITVGEDGLLLSKDVKAFEEVGLAGPQWLLILYVLATCGELCLSPISLSMVTKLSPARCTSMMMGLFFSSWAVSNFLAHTFAAYSKNVAAGDWFTLLGGQVDYFVILTIAPLIVSVVVFLLSPKIKRMMHGLH